VVALVAEVSASRNDEDQCRDAKNDSNTQRFIMNWTMVPKRITIFPREAVNMKQQWKRRRDSSSMK
jgi:hypothetical protein